MLLISRKLLCPKVLSCKDLDATASITLRSSGEEEKGEERRGREEHLNSVGVSGETEGKTDQQTEG
jgi:hypothetical protein